MTKPTIGLDETKPAGTRSIKLGDDDIREHKVQVREIMEVDHEYPTSGQSATAGQHKQVTLQEQADLGTGATGVPIFGAQTVSGVAEMVWTTEGDVDLQFTSGAGFHPDILNHTGMITLWSGLLSAIPTGWQLCDGTNSTPDIRDKMIPCVAAATDPGAVSGDGYVGAHTHTGGAHTHTNSAVTVSLKVKNGSDQILDTLSGSVVNSTAFSNATAIADTGSGGAVASASTGSATFYALAYIYKT